MKNLKKIITVLLIVTLLPMFTPEVAFAEADFDPPVISNYRLETSAEQPLHAGDTVTLFADITDESGISEVRAGIIEPNGDSFVNVGGVNEDGDTWSFTLIVPENPWPGMWRFSSIYIKDNSANSNSRIEPTTIMFEVENNEKGDIAPPVLSNYRLDTSVVQPLHAGDTVTLLVDIVDESGVSETYVGITDSKGSGGFGNIYGIKEEGNTWSFTFTIPEDPWPGMWRFFSISAKDSSTNANDILTIINSYPTSMFEVENDNKGDIDSPVLSNYRQNISVNQPLHAGDTATLLVDITDESGISEARVGVYGPQNQGTNVQGVKEEGDTWSFTFTIPEDPFPGMWRFANIYVKDNSTNANTINTGINSVDSFEVAATEYSDEVPPIIVSYSVSPTENEPGYNITVDATITDNMNVKTVRMTLISPTGTEYVGNDMMRDGISNNWSVTKTLPSDATEGIWKCKIEAWDLAENKTTEVYDNAFAVNTPFIPDKPVPTSSNFTLSNATKSYNGKPQGVVIGSVAGMGKITVKYNGSVLAPVNAGKYNITVDVTEGTKYEQASGIYLGTLTINKALISNTSLSIENNTWTGKQIKPSISTLTYNGMKLSVGSTIGSTKYGTNKNIGKGTVTLIGKGNFIGSKTITFNIIPKRNSVRKVTVGKKRMKVIWRKVSKAQKVTRYQVRYRVRGAKKWRIKTYKAKYSSATIKRLKKGKRYQIQVRSYKIVSGKKYYSAWSKTKTSKKIKK